MTNSNENIKGGVQWSTAPKFWSAIKDEISALLKTANLSFRMFFCLRSNGLLVPKLWSSKVRGVPKSRMHFFIIPIHLCAKTLTLRFLANLLKNIV